MRVVHKFPMDDRGGAVLYLCDPIIRHVGEDIADFHDIPCVWIERDPIGEPTHRITLEFFGTGAPVPDVDGWDFAGTVVLKSAGFVWHVYTSTVPL